MASSIERAEAEVQRAIAEATAIAKREGITLAAAEAELWTALLALQSSRRLVSFELELEA